MRVQNLTFDTWKLNHSPEHDDKWCRELYPFHIFRLIDFDESLIETVQRIKFNKVLYKVKVKKIEIQENKRYRTTFDIITEPTSKTQEWKQRRWNTTFQIVYTEDFKFITIFTKKEDPSKEYVVKFMKGNFQKIVENKSLPVSELLFRTLLLQLAEEGFTGGIHNEEFQIGANGIRELDEHYQFKGKNSKYSPIYSISRELWVCYTFSEERAHRIAFHVANQANRLIVVYCNPTYTKHHRCKFQETSILSLYEFSNIISPEVRRRYENQVRFLQSHLNQFLVYDSKQLLLEIENPKFDFYEIEKSDLMEALGVMKIIPTNNLDLFHTLAAVNLINAYLSKQRKEKTLQDKDKNLFRNMYFFKTYLSDVLTDRIIKRDYSIPIYIDRELIIIEALGFQFSFHNVPMNEELKAYESSEYNKEIPWRGKKLQPVAPLILKYSHTQRQNRSR